MAKYRKWSAPVSVAGGQRNSLTMRSKFRPKRMSKSAQAKLKAVYRELPRQKKRRA